MMVIAAAIFYVPGSSECLIFLIKCCELVNYIDNMTYLFIDAENIINFCPA